MKSKSSDEMNKRILKLSLPSVLANITVPLVGIADVAVSGRLGSAAAIGAIAIGSMLFDILYWNFGFLRIGTGGLTAQAYGKRSFRDAIKYLSQGISTALFSALFLILIQWFFAYTAFEIIECSDEVAELAKQYFYIRIWAAPATLCLFVFRGWFIGMQNTVSPMVIDIAVNLLNLGLSIYLGLFTPLGIVGIAIGTVIAQYGGILLCLSLMSKFYKKLFHYFNIKKDVKLKYMKDFYIMNTNLFIRSLGFMAIYSGFTVIAAKYGDQELAVSTIILKLLLLFSYFIDGFAYAGEALTGRYIGAKNKPALVKAVKLLFIWALIIGTISTVAYALWGDWMLRTMTTEISVISAAQPYLHWLILMPLISCAAFIWDGIYVGATASVAIRNCMIIAAIGFYVTYFLLKSKLGVEALYYAYFMHLIIRMLHLSIASKKNIFERIQE